MDTLMGHNLTVLLTALIVLTSLTVCSAEATGESIARGCPVTFDTPPNYPLCADGNDPLQLTDGEYCGADPEMWKDKRAVGWQAVSPAVFTIDLGKVQPISGVSYSTAAGIAGVTWLAS